MHLSLNKLDGLEDSNQYDGVTIRHQASPNIKTIASQPYLSDDSFITPPKLKKNSVYPFQNIEVFPTLLSPRVSPPTAAS